MKKENFERDDGIVDDETTIVNKAIQEKFYAEEKHKGIDLANLNNQSAIITNGD